jgi:hypothetical protein
VLIISCVVLSLFFSFDLVAQIPDSINVVRPLEINDVLINPGIGFTTFQMFNGDNHQANQDVLREVDLEKFDNSPGSLENINQPGSSIAYFRIQWRAIEPEMGQYRWDYIDSLLVLAQEHGQTLALRISPYKGRLIDDVPVWFRELVGPQRKFKHIKWPVDPENPNYAYYFGNMIRALGERYDGHPNLENIDVSIVGWAGEGGGSGLLSDKTIKALLDPYIESFQKTPLIVLLSGKRVNEYITAKVNVGWRQDCLGDIGFWADEQNGWTHMYDYYPQVINEFDMQDAWKTGHVTFEICGVFQTWNSGSLKSRKSNGNNSSEEQGFTKDQVQYIIDQSLKWHISSFNGKSSEVPKKWQPMVDQWLKKMGYRLVLRRFTCPKEVAVNSKMDVTTWWENKGVAPCYKKFILALKMKNDEQEVVITTKADITKWLPGDNVYNTSVFIPADLEPGIYDIQIALADPVTFQPKVRLAIEGRGEDGWYDLDQVKLVR